MGGEPFVGKAILSYGTGWVCDAQHFGLLRLTVPTRKTAMTEIQQNKNAALIHSSLEHVAERVTDLTPQVYARYFARHPEARVLFGHDDDDDLKGDMLSRLIIQIMD